MVLLLSQISVIYQICKSTWKKDMGKILIKKIPEISELQRYRKKGGGGMIMQLPNSIK